MDITIGRDMTINTGNYGNIKPHVTITLKDIDNMNESYDKISNVLDSIMGLEIIKMMDESNSIANMGLSEYYTHLLSCKDMMEKDIIEFTNESVNV